jgi:hypothetical protein
LKLESPEYVAVTKCAPGDKLKIPLGVLPFPLLFSELVARNDALSRKLTIPVGVPKPDFPATSALK